MTDSVTPSEWHKTTLGAVAQWGSGGTPSRKNPDYYGGDVPWVKTGDLGPKVLSAASEYITELGVQKSSAKYFPKGSVAIAMYGATIGKTSILGFDATTNQACAVGRPVERITDTTFLYYLLRNEKDAFIAKGKGGAQPNISQALIKEHGIALPPLAEQKVIADKLDTLLAQVENTKARLERIPQILKRFRQSVLAAAVSGRLTEEWRSENEYVLGIEKYLDLVKGFKIKAKGLVEPVQERNWLSCQLGHILSVKSGDGLISKRMIPEGGIAVYGGNGINGYHDQANTSKPTIVIGRVGFYCGSVHLTEAKSWVTDNALIVSFPEELLNTDFVYWLLMATNLREDTASSAQPVISGSKIYGIKISLPPVEEQTEIVRRVDQLFAHADRIEQQVNNAQARVNNLTQSILAKAFRGELTEQWRKDNPELISGENSAEALLERIKAERADGKPVRRTKKQANSAR